MNATVTSSPTQTSRTRRVVWMLSVLVAVITLAFLYRVNPVESSFYPKCTFHVLTGLDCPGCGGLRATHQLLHGNVIAAFKFNPLLVCMLPVAAILAINWVIAKTHTRVVLVERPKVIWSFAVIVIAFGFLRNLPWKNWFG